MSVPNPFLIDRNKVCFIVGPSPKNLPSQSYDFSNKVNKNLLLKLKDFYIDLIESKGKSVFLCSLNLGVDIWSCRLLLKLKEDVRYNHIKVVGIIPHSGFGNSWSPSVKDEYRRVLSLLDSFIEVYKLADYKLVPEARIVDLVEVLEDGTTRIIVDGDVSEYHPTRNDKIKKSLEFLVDYSSAGVIVHADDFESSLDCCLYASQNNLGDCIYLVNPYSLNIQEGIL